MFKLNPNAAQAFKNIGKENTPIYVVEDVLLNPEKLTEQAVNSHNFEAVVNKGYPGNRAPLDESYVKLITNAITPALRKLYNIPSHLKLHTYECNYSIIDRAEKQLSPFQSIPHVDSSKPLYFAIMHYINPGDFGGTSFYRHIPSGFENIHQERERPYVESLQKYLDTFGYPEQKYFRDSTNHFELIGKTSYKSNSLVAYPGTLLHSAYIDPNIDIGQGVAKGRLTANIFAEFK